MIPLKWKIFRIANLVQLIGLLACIGLLMTRFLQNTLRGGPVFTAFFAGFLFMACANYFNLHILSKYFPDRSIPPILKKINTILLIIGFTICALLVMIIIAGSLEEFKDVNRNSYEGKIILLVFFVIFMNWAYILYMQIKMFRLIRKQHHQSLNAMVNSLGE
jgi:hypothetical protein